MPGPVHALRGRAVSFDGNPFLQPARECLVHHEDALIVVEDGRIAAFGAYGEVRARLERAVGEDVELVYACALRDRANPRVNRQLLNSVAQP